MHHRYYSPRLGHFLTPDYRAPNIYDPSTFTEPYAYAAGNPLYYMDPDGLSIGIFFDGTWNDEQKMQNPTNVYKLYDLYVGEAVYVRGVGTKPFSSLTGTLFERKAEELLGGLSGYGGKERLLFAYESLINLFQQEFDKVQKGQSVDLEIDLFGFSRGSAQARAFANLITEFGIPVKKNNGSSILLKPNIRFLGIYDTVSSHGIPGNNINIGYDLTTPPTVRFVRHATAENEYRSAFPLSSVVNRKNQHFLINNQALPRVIEKSFPGAHSDVGGGYSNDGFKDDKLAKIPLKWMYDEAALAGVKLKPIKQKDAQIPHPNQWNSLAHDSMDDWKYFKDLFKRDILGLTPKRKVYYPNENTFYQVERNNFLWWRIDKSAGLTNLELILQFNGVRP